jgi:hypothetical protein
VYRKVFKINKWESVKELIFMLGRLDILHLVSMRRMLFVQRLSLSTNSVMSELMQLYLHSPEFKTLCVYNSLHLGFSAAKVKAIMFNSFKSLIFNSNCV